MENRTLKNEQLKEASALALELIDEGKQDQTISQNMVDSLIIRVDDVDADDIISGLQGGIKSFHENWDRAEEQGLELLVDSSLNEILKERTEDEKVGILCEILEACAAASGQVVPEGLADVEQIPALQSAVKEYICEYSILSLNDEVTVKLLPELGSDRVQKIKEAEEESKLEMYTALALYILKVSGRGGDIPAAMSPQEIGVSTAAAMCKQKTIYDGIHGKIDWDTVKSRLKLIAGVALITLLTVAAAKVIIAAGAVVYCFTEIVVGMGMIGTIAGGLFGLWVVGSLGKLVFSADKQIGDLTGVSEKVAEGTAKIKTWIDDTIQPAAKSFWEKIRAMIKSCTARRDDMETVGSTARAKRKQKEVDAVRA